LLLHTVPLIVVPVLDVHTFVSLGFAHSLGMPVFTAMLVLPFNTGRWLASLL
jgi:hypothetical protein